MTAGIVALTLIACASLGLQGSVWPDWSLEAQPSVDALLHGHPGAFFASAPVYGGSLLLRAPFFELGHLLGAGASVYRAGAVPALLAAAALGVWLSRQLGRRGCAMPGQVATLMLCIAGPIGIMSLQQGHPEDLLGGVLCAAAVLCARRDRAVWSGVLVGLAIANQPWGVLAAGPVLVALSRGRLRGLAAMVVTTAVVLAPFVLVRSGAFVAQTKAIGLTPTSIFGPWQLWWFLGAPSSGGTRLEPTWLIGWAHTLPIAIMPPLSLAYALVSRRHPERRRGDAMLLLALLLLLRCALDPWDTIYYPAPFLVALLVWEAINYPRAPLVAYGATALAWFAFQGTAYAVHYRANATAAIFISIAVPGVLLIVRRLVAAPTTRPQTAETSSSSATRNDEPQPQAATTLGLSTLKPAP